MRRYEIVSGCFKLTPQLDEVKKVRNLGLKIYSRFNKRHRRQERIQNILVGKAIIN